MGAAHKPKVVLERWRPNAAIQQEKAVMAMKSETGFKQQFADAGSIADLQNYANQQPGWIRTVLIGLGGTGTQVLLRIRRRLFENNMTCDRPGLAFVCIDTLPEAELLKGAADYIARRVEFSTSEYVSACVDAKTVREYMDMPQQHPYVNKWLPRPEEWQVTKIDEGAGACRPAGRLAFYEHFLKIKDAIQTAVQKVVNPGVDVQHEGLHAVRRQFIVVTSLAGGTGTGMFLDLGLLLLKHWENFERVGIFTLPDIYPEHPNGDIHRVNTYAATKELELFQTKDVTPAEKEFLKYQFPGEAEASKSLQVPLYEFPYILGATNEAKGEIAPDESDRRAFFEMIAENIWWDLTRSGFSDHKRGIRFNLNARHLQNEYQHTYRTEKGEPIYKEVFCTRYLCMGCTKLELPVARLLERVAYRRALDIVEFWLRRPSGSEDPTQVAVKKAVCTAAGIGADSIRKVMEGVQTTDGGNKISNEVKKWRGRVESEALRCAGTRTGKNAATCLEGELSAAEARWFDGNKVVGVALHRAGEKLAEELIGGLTQVLEGKLDQSGLLWVGNALKQVATILEGERATQMRKEEAVQDRLKTYRGRFERAQEDLRFVEVQWGNFHPLRSRSFPVLVRRSASAAQAVLQLRLDSEVDAATLKVLAKLQDAVKTLTQEMKNLFNIVRQMSGAVGALLKNHREIQSTSEVFAEVSANDEEERFYRNVCRVLRGNRPMTNESQMAEVSPGDEQSERQQLDSEAKVFLRNRIKPSPGKGEPTLRYLIRCFAEVPDVHPLVVDLLEMCHTNASRVCDQVSVHILDHKQNGVAWWPIQMAKVAAYGTPWVDADNAFTGTAADGIGGYACLGVEAHPQSVKLKDDLAGRMGPFLRSDLVATQNGCKHSAVLICEIGGFPLLYVKGISSWFHRYQNPPNRWPVHLDPRFVDIRDLVLMKPDEVIELDQIYECLVLGVMLGELERRPNESDGTAHFHIVQRIVGTLQSKDLGPEAQAIRRLRTVNGGGEIRNSTLQKIRNKRKTMPRNEAIKLLKVVHHYYHQIYQVDRMEESERGRLLGALRVKELWNKLTRELSEDSTQPISEDEAYDLVAQPPNVRDFTEDPCEDGWLTMNTEIR